MALTRPKTPREQAKHTEEEGPEEGAIPQEEAESRGAPLSVAASGGEARPSERRSEPPTEARTYSVPGYSGHPRVKKMLTLRLSEPLQQQIAHVAAATGYRSTHELLVRLVEQEVETRMTEEGYTADEIRQARESTGF